MTIRGPVRRSLRRSPQKWDPMEVDDADADVRPMDVNNVGRNKRKERDETTPKAPRAKRSRRAKANHHGEPSQQKVVAEPQNQACDEAESQSLAALAEALVKASPRTKARPNAADKKLCTARNAAKPQSITLAQSAETVVPFKLPVAAAPATTKAAASKALSGAFSNASSTPRAPSKSVVEVSYSSLLRAAPAFSKPSHIKLAATAVSSTVVAPAQGCSDKSRKSVFLMVLIVITGLVLSVVSRSLAPPPPPLPWLPCTIEESLERALVVDPIDKSCRAAPTTEATINEMHVQLEALTVAYICGEPVPVAVKVTMPDADDSTSVSLVDVQRPTAVLFDYVGLAESTSVFNGIVDWADSLAWLKEAIEYGILLSPLLETHTSYTSWLFSTQSTWIGLPTSIIAELPLPEDCIAAAKQDRAASLVQSFPVKSIVADKLEQAVVQVQSAALSAGRGRATEKGWVVWGLSQAWYYGPYLFKLCRFAMACWKVVMAIAVIILLVLLYKLVTSIFFVRWGIAGCKLVGRMVWWILCFFIRLLPGAINNMLRFIVWMLRLMVNIMF